MAVWGKTRLIRQCWLCGLTDLLPGADDQLVTANEIAVNIPGFIDAIQVIFSGIPPVVVI